MREDLDYPDYIGVSDVTTRAFEQMRVEAYTDGQVSLMFDEPEGFDIGDPPELSGRSRGWTPVHAQLAALAACTSITISVVARDQGFRYRGLTTKVRSLIDIRGFFFDLHMQPNYEQVNFDLHVETRESVKRLRALASETDRRCPQIGLFRRAGVPMVMSWFKAGRDEPALVERFHIDDATTPEERLALEARPGRRRRRARR